MKKIKNPLGNKQQVYERLLGLALDFERQNLVDKAAEAYREAIEAAPHSSKPREELARLLFNAGRSEESEDMLRTALTLPDHSSNSHILLGRILECKGSMKEAERLYSAAIKRLSSLGFHAESSKPPNQQLSEALICLGRVRSLEGKHRSALDSLELASRLNPQSPEIWGALSECLLNQMHLGDAEKAARKALSINPLSMQAQIALIKILLQSGKFEDSEREAVRFLKQPRRSLEPIVPILCKLIDAGRYSPLDGPLLNAFQNPLKSQCWLEIFFALVGADFYAEAFRLGELMMESFPQKASASELSMLLWPWSRKVGRGVSEEAFCLRALRQLDSCGIEDNLSHWRAYLRCCLLISCQGRTREALAFYPEIAARPESKFFWMRQPFILARLLNADYDGVIEDCRTILSHREDAWWARCRLAEALLLSGEPKKAIHQLHIAESKADSKSLPEILTWYGEILLWLGRYGQAFEKLDEAVRLGGTLFVFGWRGAAHLKLGRPRQALADLNRAIELDSKDLEAFVWRAEVHRTMARHREALEDLRYVLERRPDYTWAYANRALSRLALGESNALEMPSPALDFFRQASGAGRSVNERPEQVRSMILSVLDRAGGIRRNEDYLNVLWLKKRSR